MSTDICYLLLPNLRSELSRPYGILFSSLDYLIDYISRFDRVITVGDVVTKNLLERNFSPFLSIIDGKTKRNVLSAVSESDNYVRIYTITNEAGVIRLSTIKLLERELNSDSKDHILIMVDGEEDLLVIPVVMYGKQGDVVVYGQPNAGAVALEITGLTKWRVKDIFSKFVVKKC